MKRLALFTLYGILVSSVRGYQNKPNQVPGPACTTNNGLTGNCVTPDEEGHDYDCANANGFFVTQEGLCPDSKVRSLPYIHSNYEQVCCVVVICDAGQPNGDGWCKPSDACCSLWVTSSGQDCPSCSPHLRWANVWGATQCCVIDCGGNKVHR